MDPHEQFCHNEGYRAYGRKGEGHVVIHSSAERRYRCKRCKKTFSATKGTAFYPIHKPHDLLVLMVLTLLAHGCCPVQAIVAAFGLDERTVARWQREAGAQCKRMHEHLVEAGRVELSQVQADELRVVRVVGGVLWLAGALEVRSSRLWLGGVVSLRRDRRLIRSLLSLPGTRLGLREGGAFMHRDGLSSYPKGKPCVSFEGSATHRKRRRSPCSSLARGGDGGTQAINHALREAAREGGRPPGGAGQHGGGGD